MYNRSQVSVEFLFAIGFVLFVFLLLLGFAFQRRVELEDTRDYLDKKAECLRIASLISSVYSGGDGTSAKTKTDYLITVYNYSSVGVGSIANITTYENRIAVLASEAGPTSQQFYDVVDESLEPDWYKICFTDLGGGGCDWNNPLVEEVDWDLIDHTLNELIANIDDYNTVYLEDPTIQYNAQYGGKSYFDILGGWVSKGNSLILSEHVVCREQVWGSYPSTSYRCNPPDYNNDVWNIFNATIYQRGGSYGNDVTVVSDPDIDIFPNLHLGDTFDFEEDSYIQGSDLEIVAEYDDNSKPAILYWRYGNGTVFYFGDFQSEPSKQEEYSGVISDLIERAYTLIIPKEEGEVRCYFVAESPFYQLTGDLTIKNERGSIIITNETEIQ